MHIELYRTARELLMNNILKTNGPGKKMLKCRRVQAPYFSQQLTADANGERRNPWRPAATPGPPCLVWGEIILKGRARTPCLRKHPAAPLVMRNKLFPRQKMPAGPPQPQWAAEICWGAAGITARGGSTLAEEQKLQESRAVSDPTCSHRGYRALLPDDVLLQPLLQRKPPALLDLPAALLLLELREGRKEVGTWHFSGQHEQQRVLRLQRAVWLCVWRTDRQTDRCSWSPGCSLGLAGGSSSLRGSKRELLSLWAVGQSGVSFEGSSWKPCS